MQILMNDSTLCLAPPNQMIHNWGCKLKGHPVEDNSVYRGLCDLCWQFGHLGSDYFPPYVNQIGCGNGQRLIGDRCLSGILIRMAKLSNRIGFIMSFFLRKW